ncbi:uncharacterized protein V1516DRAFT_143201 [Lipomyces oligophaga]|uniref:uncharacterized protein n=1 Tax=Lipomyces oligophaga TaxID=45792 RepID=UPI0034CFF70A
MPSLRKSTSNVSTNPSSTSSSRAKRHLSIFARPQVPEFTDDGSASGVVPRSRPRIPIIYDSKVGLDPPPTTSNYYDSQPYTIRDESGLKKSSQAEFKTTNFVPGSKISTPSRNKDAGAVSLDIDQTQNISSASNPTASAKTGLRVRNINQLLKREWNDWGAKRNYKAARSDRGEVGWEPGIDVRNTVVELGDDSMVTIVDYSKDRYRIVNKIDKFTIKNFLNDKQDWASVRWINVNGLSWDVVRCLAEFYNLHPLAIEDMVDVPKRAKADHYRNQTFCTLPLHKLISTAAVDSYYANLTQHSTISRLLSPLLGKKKKILDSMAINANLSRLMQEQNMMTMIEWNNPNMDPELLMLRRTLERFHEVVAVEQVSIFLIEDNTVISFFENSAEDVEGPILARITSSSTLLREYPEASLLLQAILDGVVDIAFNIISEYQRYIVELQVDVLTSPSVAHTRDLHILSEELSMLRMTLLPIYTLVQTLRDHAKVGAEITLAGGRISEFAKLYLSDVADHVLSFTDNIDLMRHTTENMINLIFNTMSVQENEAMKQLTIVTIIFLPLTFLTGYFGMNFVEFGALENTTMYFWSIAIPVTAFVMGLLMWSTIRTILARMIRHYRRRNVRKRRREHQKYHSESNQVFTNGEIAGDASSPSYGTSSDLSEKIPKPLLPVTGTSSELESDKSTDRQNNLSNTIFQSADNSGSSLAGQKMVPIVSDVSQASFDTHSQPIRVLAPTAIRPDGEVYHIAHILDQSPSSSAVDLTYTSRKPTIPSPLNMRRTVSTIRSRSQSRSRSCSPMPDSFRSARSPAPSVRSFDPRTVGTQPASFSSLPAIMPTVSSPALSLSSEYDESSIAGYPLSETESISRKLSKTGHIASVSTDALHPSAHFYIPPSSRGRPLPQLQLPATLPNRFGRDIEQEWKSELRESGFETSSLDE